MKNYKKNIVHIGISGFPYGGAPFQRMLFLAKALQLVGFSITIINNKAVHGKALQVELKKDGFFDQIKYHYTTISPYRPSSFLGRRISNFFGRVGELFYLFNLKISGKLNSVLYYSNGNFFELIYFRILSLLLNFNLIINYVELRSSIAERNNKLLYKVNDKLFDEYFGYFVDGIIPISHYLTRKVKKFNRPHLLIPPITDYTLFNNSQKKESDEKYFLYCGSSSYSMVINFIIESFEIINDNEFFLYLVISGNRTQKKKIYEKIASSNKKFRIKTFSSIDYEDLINLYKNASALLIPLRPTIQDIARFPHKVSEYLASGNPIITTRYGEIDYYFEDNVNALIASEFSLKAYSEKMVYVINHPNKARRIGEIGKKMGSKLFDYQNYSLKLSEFIMDFLK